MYDQPDDRFIPFTDAERADSALMQAWHRVLRHSPTQATGPLREALRQRPVCVAMAAMALLGMFVASGPHLPTLAISGTFAGVLATGLWFGVRIDRHTAPFARLTADQLNVLAASLQGGSANCLRVGALVAQWMETGVVWSRREMSAIEAWQDAWNRHVKDSANRQILARAHPNLKAAMPASAVAAAQTLALAADMPTTMKQATWRL